MLDTIICILRQEDLERLEIQLDIDALLQNALYDRRNGSLKFTPSGLLQRERGYFPSVSLLFARPSMGLPHAVYELKIQCSVPKIVFGTSYFMTDEQDFDIFCQRLSDILAQIGIRISPEQVADFPITSFTVCWNILLPKRFGDPKDWLPKLSFLDQGIRTQSYTHSQYEETESGFCLREYSQNRHTRIYLKNAEIQNNPKTTIDYDIAHHMKQELIPDSILRIEKGFQKRSACREVIQAYYGLNPSQEVSIAHLFDNGFCKFHLSDMVDRLKNRLNALVTDIASNVILVPISALLDIAKTLHLTSGETSHFIAAVYGVAQCGAKGYRVLRSEILGRTDQQQMSAQMSWLAKKFESENLSGFLLCDLMKEIEEQVSSFSVYKTEESARLLMHQIEDKYARPIQPSAAHKIWSAVQEKLNIATPNNN